MGDYLYRVRPTAYPQGAVEPICNDDDCEEPDRWAPVPGWKPPGWKPERNYVKMLGTTDFVWPSTRPLYRSRSTAKRRAKLLESFGATVVIERSGEIFWPEHPREAERTVLVSRRRGHLSDVGDSSTEAHVECGETDESSMDLTPAVARERSTLVVGACDEIDQRGAQDKQWVRGGPLGAGGSQGGEAHVEATPRPDEEIADRTAWLLARFPLPGPIVDVDP